MGMGMGQRQHRPSASWHRVRSGRVGVAARKGVDEYLDTLKWDAQGLVVAIAQDVDTGAVLMQAFANRQAVKDTMATKRACFYSRSRQGQWCKGETSGHFLNVTGIYVDCDADSIIYQCKPIGPACHTGAPTCWFLSIAPVSGREEATGTADPVDAVELSDETPLPTLKMLEEIIKARALASSPSGSGSGTKSSWTAKLLNDPELVCSKVREEAGELCQALEQAEGDQRVASEMADLLYHAMVLIRMQGVDLGDVMQVLRKRFGVSGIDEKAARKK